MSLTFRTDFPDDNQARKELIRFIKQIHNLDLTRWDELGYWDSNYRPFSYFDGDRMVANACLYSMDMRVNGNDMKVAQVSGVGVDPEYRQQGLAYDLNMKAIEWASDSHDFYYLFADTEAFRLYDKCGFRKAEEHKFVIPVQGNKPNPGVRKLDMKLAEDRELVWRLANERTPVSDIWGVNNPKLLMFWALYFLKEGLSYIESLDSLVLCDRADDCLTIHDLVGKEIRSFDQIYPFIGEPEDRRVEFLFIPDLLGLNVYDPVALGLTPGTHLMGVCPVENEPFAIPTTARA